MRPGFGLSVATGALHGTAVWSAYALLEFAFASVLFRLSRPHAVFSAWHWKLTARLFLGYLIAGPICGALAGAAAWILRGKVRISVDAAATFTLVLAFGMHVGVDAAANRFWLLAASSVFGGLLLIRRWNDRAGWLTNYWIVSGLLLGFGQVLGFQEMGFAGQLGARLGVATWLLAAFLLGLAATSVFVGRKFQLPAAPLRNGAIGGAAFLLVASYALGRPAS